MSGSEAFWPRPSLATGSWPTSCSTVRGLRAVAALGCDRRVGGRAIAVLLTRIPRVAAIGAALAVSSDSRTGRLRGRHSVDVGERVHHQRRSAGRRGFGPPWTRRLPALRSGRPRKSSRWSAGQFGVTRGSPGGRDSSAPGRAVRSRWLAAATRSGRRSAHAPAVRRHGRSGGGLLEGSRPSAELTALLERDADRYTWMAAAVVSNAASGYQLATQQPVMPIGGFKRQRPVADARAVPAVRARGEGPLVHRRWWLRWRHERERDRGRRSAPGSRRTTPLGRSGR